MSPCQAGRALMAFHFDRLLANEVGTLEGSEPEALHDMRVATRRLRAALRVFRSAFHQEALRTLAEDTRWLAAALGRVRDLDVFLLWLEEYGCRSGIVERAAVHEIMEEVRGAREGERQALIADLSSPRYARLRDGFSRFLTEEEVPTPYQPLLDFSADAILAQVRNARRWRKRVRDNKNHDQAALHGLRIAAKRLRYTSEFFSSLYDERSRELTADSVALQDALGSMRDAHLQAARLECLRGQADCGVIRRAALSRMIVALQRQQAEQYDAYLRIHRRVTGRKAAKRAKRLLRAP